MWEDASILAMQVMQLVPKAEDCMHNIIRELMSIHARANPNTLY